MPGSLTQGFVPERSFAKDRRVIDMHIDSVVMACGTRDQCSRQITDLIEYGDGPGNLLVMAQAGFLSHAEQSTALMAKEIMPRLKEYKQPAAAVAAA